MRVTFIVLILFLASIHYANAQSCNDYEVLVSKMIREARGFQRTDRFRELGWSASGPTNNWLDRFRAMRDNKNELKLLIAHNFSLADVYIIADEYRTKGRLDNYQKEIENSFQVLDSCK